MPGLVFLFKKIVFSERQRKLSYIFSYIHVFLKLSVFTKKYSVFGIIFYFFQKCTYQRKILNKNNYKKK